MDAYDNVLYTYYSILQYGSFRKFGVPYSRVLTLRILLLRVLY